jgi:hypothetical protein
MVGLQNLKLCCDASERPIAIRPAALRVIPRATVFRVLPTGFLVERLERADEAGHSVGYF